MKKANININDRVFLVLNNNEIHEAKLLAIEYKRNNLKYKFLVASKDNNNSNGDISYVNEPQMSGYKQAMIFRTIDDALNQEPIELVDFQVSDKMVQTDFTVDLKSTPCVCLYRMKDLKVTSIRIYENDITIMEDENGINMDFLGFTRVRIGDDGCYQYVDNSDNRLVYYKSVDECKKYNEIKIYRL